MGIKLGEICMFQSGGTPAKRKTEYFNGNIPWITTTALNGGKVGKSDAVDWITDKAIVESAAKIVPAFSIMVGTRVGVGKVALNTVDMSTSQDIVSLIGIDESVWSKDFLCKFIQGKSAYLNEQARGATIKGIKIDVLASLELPTISLEEQRHISDVIDSTKTIIAFRQHELQKLDDLIKARFVELFGDIITNERGWQTDKWSNVLRIVNGRNQKAVEADDGEYLICGSGGVMGRAADYLTKENSVIVGRKGNINKPILMRQKYWNVDTAFGIEPNEEFIIVDYFYMFCVFFNFEKLNKAVTIPSLTKADLLNIEMPIPDKGVQKQFAVFVEQVDKSKVAVQKALDETQLLFDSLMQEYFGS